MHAFFGTPTRGGRLTIVNCLLWAIVAVGVAADMPLLLFPALVACWPVAWLFILPMLGDRSRSAEAELVVACVVIGVNSLLWGYGISWLLSLTVDQWRRPGPEQRGVEVVASTAAELPSTTRADARRES